MGRKLEHPLFAALFVLTALQPVAARAQTAVNVAHNGAAVIDLQSDAGAVTVVNPDIADVTPMGGKRLIVMGRAVGQTDLLVYDRSGQNMLSARLTVTPQLSGNVVVHRGVEEDVMVCAPVCASNKQRRNAPPAGEGASETGAAAVKNLLGGNKPAE